MSIYARWQVPEIINCAGTVTRLGGALMPSQVVEAMAEAAYQSVSLEQLQAAASRVIARITGAESGLVTSGAAAAVTLGTAAILTGLNPARMEKLPVCTDFPHQMVIPRDHRNGYDHAVRAAGAVLVEVGFNEPQAGSGVRCCELWEIEAAFGPLTAGVFYVCRPDAQPALQDVVRLAHQYQLPVLVDAAGQVPPKENLRRLVASGADLVAFSGGKGIRGPQATGFLCGKRDLVAAAALQMLDTDEHIELWAPPDDWLPRQALAGLPRQGIGRGMKVAKEQIVGLLVALELYVQGAYDDEIRAGARRLEFVMSQLSHLPVTCQLVASAEGELPPQLHIRIDPVLLGRSVWEVCRNLRCGKPPVYVNTSELSRNTLVIDPTNLRDDQLTVLTSRLQEELGVVRMA